ncbi:MAG: hypothetical protein RLZ51_658 [Pseudomonadota bacterium]
MNSTSRPTESLARFFDAIHREAQARFGPCLLTVSQLDALRDPFRLSRIYSSDPQAYPVGGFKDKPDSDWTHQVLRLGQTHVGEGAQALVRVFDDHERIVALGLLSVINQPIVDRDRVLGTFNLLSQQAHWPPDATAQVMIWAKGARAWLQALTDL